MVYHPIIYSVIVTNGQEFLPSVGGDGWKGWQLCMNISGRTWDVPSMPSWLVVYADFPLWFSPQVANQRWCWAAWCWAPWTDITNLTAVSMTIADPLVSLGFSSPWIWLFRYVPWYPPISRDISSVQLVFRDEDSPQGPLRWSGEAGGVPWCSAWPRFCFQDMVNMVREKWPEGKMTHFPGLLQPSSTLYITYIYIYYIYILYIYVCNITVYI